MTVERTFQNRTEPGADGSVRKAHYGAGRQPWDDILDAGWGPAFAAGCVLRYLRRTKDHDHSLESARWYVERLVELAAKNDQDALAVLDRLTGLLTRTELELVSLER